MEIRLTPEFTADNDSPLSHLSCSSSYLNDSLTVFVAIVTEYADSVHSIHYIAILPITSLTLTYS